MKGTARLVTLLSRVSHVGVDPKISWHETSLLWLSTQRRNDFKLPRVHLRRLALSLGLEEGQFGVMTIYVTSRSSSYFYVLSASLQLSCTTLLVASLSIATFRPCLELILSAI